MDNETQKKYNNKYKNEFIKMKRERREKKRTTKRSVTGEEVIFIFVKSKRFRMAYKNRF